jgi:ATPase family associated with various cellular activities (AAA)
MEIDTDDIANELSHWGRIKMPVTVPSYWVALIKDFAKVAAELLAPEVLENTALRVTHLKTRLHFDVDPPSDLGATTDKALKALSQGFADLSDFMAQASAGPDQGGDENNCKVFSWKSNVSGAASCRSSESAERMNITLKRLKAAGQFRPIQKPGKNWVQEVEQLAKDFPNFESVVRTVIAPHLSILDKGGHHRQSPILLIGEAGIGKTHFAHSAAKVMGLRGAMFISLAEESNGAALAGSSAFWSNSAPGKLFEQMAWGDGWGSSVANPLIILDEIDKCSADRYDPLAALYGLLEAETAARFQDQALPDIVMDVSRARFICTANYANRIPEPLLTRLTVFQIEKPSEDQLRGVVRKMFRDLAEGVRLGMHTQLPDEIVEAALQMSPRESKLRMECALAVAVMSDRKFVTLEDWPDFQTVGQQRKRMGFVH